MSQCSPLYNPSFCIDPQFYYSHSQLSVATVLHHRCSPNNGDFCPTVDKDKYIFPLSTVSDCPAAMNGRQTVVFQDRCVHVSTSAADSSTLRNTELCKDYFGETATSLMLQTTADREAFDAYRFDFTVDNKETKLLLTPPWLISTSYTWLINYKAYYM